MTDTANASDDPGTPVERRPDTWQERAGVALVMGWASHAREPYATDLLVALMREHREVHFVVAFDGFFYDAADVEGGDQSCTLSLWAVARRADSYAASYVRHAKERAPAFVSAWIDGWRTRAACRGS